MSWSSHYQQRLWTSIKWISVVFLSFYNSNLISEIIRFFLLLGLLLTSGENVKSTVPLEIYILGEMVTFSMLILPAVYKRKRLSNGEFPWFSVEPQMPINSLFVCKLLNSVYVQLLLINDWGSLGCLHALFILVALKSWWKCALTLQIIYGVIQCKYVLFQRDVNDYLHSSMFDD